MRKDIERAFGVLQAKFQCMQRPFYELDLDSIAAKVSCCLILHNMGVSDRVMDGDVYARYNPCNKLDLSLLSKEKITLPDDLVEVQNRNKKKLPVVNVCVIGTKNKDYDASRLVNKAERFHCLNDLEEHVRLQDALKDLFE